MTPPTNSFCFAPKFNSAEHLVHGKMFIPHDATGAFHPYMEAFKRLYSNDDGTVTTLQFDNHAGAAARYQAIEHGFAVAPAQLDAVVYFGHGMPDKMVSPHIMEDDIPRFADLIRRNSVQGVTVVLYACLCGRVNHPGGCFASKLANELSDLQATVYGHNDVGHTATNPHIYRYVGNNPGVLVSPPGMAKEFDRVLKAESIDHKPRGNSAFWARIPFMDDDEILAEIGG